MWQLSGSPEGARAAHLLLGAAPGQRGRHQPHKGGALLVGAVRRVESYAAHLQLLPLQQSHQALLAGVRLLRPCNATCTHSSHEGLSHADALKPLYLQQSHDALSWHIQPQPKLLSSIGRPMTLCTLTYALAAPARHMEQPNMCLRHLEYYGCTPL